MTFVIPLAVAAGLTIFGLMASKKEEAGSTPALPPSPDAPPGGADVHPSNQQSAPPGALPPSTTANTGDTAVAHADDAFDAAVAAAVAAGDVATLDKLATEAESKGLLTVARSIRDEIARIKGEAPKVTKPGPDMPVPTATLATYIIKAGDTGTSIAKAYTGNGNRWPELVTVNPSTKDAKVGFKAYPGQRVNIPASWPAGIPVVSQAPSIASPPPVAHTYTVQNGDTGMKVAHAFTGDSAKWTELLKANPSLKSAKYGIALYTGHKVNLPANWPETPMHASTYTAPAAAVTQPVPLPAAPPAPPQLPAPTPDPQLVPPAESPARTAARDLTAYLTSIGGLAGRFKEDRKKVSGYLAAMGVPDSTGMYGRQGAGAVMQNGFVPVVPFYWPKTGAAQAKTTFSSLVKSFQAADPQRDAAWVKLLSDIQRA
jgi:nucleoid-associated protein YgaU